MSILSFATLAASFSGRHPNLPKSGQIPSISAAGEAGTVHEIQAGAVRGFASPGTLQWVKAKSHFYVAGETVLEGDFVQVQELDAKLLRHANRADYATDEELAAAQKAKK